MTRCLNLKTKQNDIHVYLLHELGSSLVKQISCYIVNLMFAGSYKPCIACIVCGLNKVSHFQTSRYLFRYNNHCFCFTMGINYILKTI